MSKFIFLDVDGVLNNQDWLLNESWSIDDDGNQVLDHIDDKNIGYLKDIVDQTGAEIVLSSSWRRKFYEVKKSSDAIEYETDNRLAKVLLDKMRNLDMRIFGKTESFMDKKDALDIRAGFTRDLEIFDWLMHHAGEGDKFIILDDEPIDVRGLFGERFIRTRFSTGLTSEDVQEAIRILGGHENVSGKL